MKVTITKACDWLGMVSVVTDRSNTSVLRVVCWNIQKYIFLPAYYPLKYSFLSGLVPSHPSTNVFDGQAEHAGHFAVVGHFEASLSSSPDQNLVENKFALLANINAFSVEELLRGELTAAVAQMVFFKNGGHI